MTDEIKPTADETPETDENILDLQAEDETPDVEAHSCISVVSAAEV